MIYEGKSQGNYGKVKKMPPIRIVGGFGELEVDCHGPGS